MKKKKICETESDDGRTFIGDNGILGLPISAPKYDSSERYQPKVGDIQWEQSEGFFSLQQYREVIDDSNPYRPQIVEKWVDVRVIKAEDNS